MHFKKWIFLFFWHTVNTITLYTYRIYAKSWALFNKWRNADSSTNYNLYCNTVIHTYWQKWLEDNSKHHTGWQNREWTIIFLTTHLIVILKDIWNYFSNIKVFSETKPTFPFDLHILLIVKEDSKFWYFIIYDALICQNVRVIGTETCKAFLPN